ncbi:MAG: bifunctional nuclease family protein, partial [Candidatus Obscuribacterales bacterium]|nr:bifunctional nuclease family protein [Candidatus Obscuribacterales bacterium]
ATILIKLNDPAKKLDVTKPLDARPSDAIAIALRAKVPIFVSAQVIADGTIAADHQKDEEEAKQFKSFIDGLKASDFQKPGSSSD